MNENTPQEIWQIDTGGQIYEANFEEMTQWIFEGALLPQDKVKRGNLRWIEARKVPLLVKFFNAKENGEPPPPVVTSMTSGDSPEASNGEPAPDFNAPNQTFGGAPPQNSENQYAEFANFTNSLEKIVIPENENFAEENVEGLGSQTAEIAEVCCMHPEVPTAFFCETCGNSFCKVCPKSYGGNVKICAFCGAMCQPVAELRENRRRELNFQTANGEKFGFGDFAAALAHPFKFKTSLFFGTLLFVFFSIGQSATAIGGVFMIVAALFGWMGANMLSFGILANTIQNFTLGRTNANFMPDFEDFAFWDDVVHPLFLSIAAYLSSFGAFILIFLIGLYMVFSALTSQATAMKQEIEKIPGTHYYDAQKTVQQSDEVKKLIEGARVSKNQNPEQQKQLAEQHKQAAIDAEEAEFAALNEMIEQSRKSQLESVVGKSPETAQKEYEQMVQGFLSLAAPLVVLLALAFLWGVFYFPAACAVAGYTRSFRATINPLVGLDTIKRLGLDYVKIFAMFVLIIIMSGVIGMFLGLLFAPFDLPRFGNMAVNVVGSVFTFYFSIVFSCILGFALYKNSAKLDLFRG